MENDAIEQCPISVCAFGVPCLDYVVQLSNSDLLDKYRFPSNGQKAVDPITFRSLLEEIKSEKYETVKCVGGSAQNILRTFQWLINESNKTVIFGAVGEDDNMYIMKKQVESDGVITRYITVKDCRTLGIIILSLQDTRLCVGMDCRKLTYPTKHLSQVDRRIVANAKVLHMDGFFLYYNPELSDNLIELPEASERIISFNVGFIYGIQTNPRLFLKVSTTSDVVFSNKDEFEALMSSNDLLSRGNNNNNDDTLIDMINYFHRIMLSDTGRSSKNSVIHHSGFDARNASERWEKILIITDGCNPVHCVYGRDHLHIVHEPVRLEDDAIVDTTGAGDAFAAGFLYGLTNDFDISTCLEIGCKTAAEIIRQPGAKLPEMCSFDTILKFK